MLYYLKNKLEVSTIMEIEKKFLTKTIPFSLEQYPYASITQSYISFSPTS